MLFIISIFNSTLTILADIVYEIRDDSDISLVEEKETNVDNIYNYTDFSAIDQRILFFLYDSVFEDIGEKCLGLGKVTFNHPFFIEIIYNN